MRFRLVSAASTNLSKLKNLGADVKGFAIINTNAAARYVKFYDVADPGPTVGTTAPALTVLVPATGQVLQSWPDGIYFQYGLWLATTVNAVDSDTTAVGAGDLIIQALYE